MNGLLTSLTYDKVTAVFIAIDNTNEALIQARLNSIYGTWPGYWWIMSVADDKRVYATLARVSVNWKEII